MNETMPYTPYGTPASDPTAQQTSQVSDLAIDMLRRTKGWVRFLSILGFIGSGFMVLAAFGMFMMTRKVGVEFGAGMGLLYIVIAILYIYPCITLWKYGSAISNLVLTRNSSDLETALDKQRSFWKFVGIMAIITIAIYIFMFISLMVTTMSVVH